MQQTYAAAMRLTQKLIAIAHVTQRLQATYVGQIASVGDEKYGHPILHTQTWRRVLVRASW